MAGPEKNKLIEPSLARKLRDNPKSLSVLNRVLEVADTLGNISEYQVEANDILRQMIDLRKQKQSVPKRLVHDYLDLCIKSGGDPQGEHERAGICAKMIMDRIVPTLKIQEIKVPLDIPPGVILLPTKKPIGSPIQIDAEDAEFRMVDVKTVGSMLDGNGKDKKPKEIAAPKTTAQKTLKKKLVDPARG